MTRLTSYKRNMEEVQRYVYALIFSDNRCYVGLTTDPSRRFRQHRSAWPDEFKAIVLDEVFGNVWECNRLEFAWRWAAQLAGWVVYASPDQVFGNLETITWPEVKAVGEKLKWPSSI